MDYLGARSIASLITLSLLLATGCGGTETIAFSIDIDSSGCSLEAKDSAPIELSLSAFADPAHLCLLEGGTVGSDSSQTLETGEGRDGEEVVVTAILRDDFGASRPADCIACYGLLRVILRPDLTRHSLELVDASACEIPGEARTSLAIPAGALPPEASCR